MPIITHTFIPSPSTEQPSPPNSQRPSSAPSTRRHHHHRHAPDTTTSPHHRHHYSNSADGNRPSTTKAGSAYSDNYRSPYAMDPDAKRDLTVSSCPLHD